MTASEAPEIFEGASTRVRGKKGMVGVRKKERGGVEWSGVQRKGKRGIERGEGRQRARGLACLCCDPSFFFFPCLLEGTKERDNVRMSNLSLPPSVPPAAGGPCDHQRAALAILAATLYWKNAGN